MQPQHIVFIGKSGSGKGTQADLVKKHLERVDDRKVIDVSTGSEFRSFMNGPSYTARRVKQELEDGKLLPTYLAIWVWTNIIVDRYSGEEHVLLDGTPRRLEEAKILDTALQFYKEAKSQVVYIDVSDEWARERLGVRGRHDDKDEEITKRLEWFGTDVMPAVDFFRGDKEHITFHNIDGEGSIEEVSERIIKSLFG